MFVSCVFFFAAAMLLPITAEQQICAKKYVAVFSRLDRQVVEAVEAEAAALVKVWSRLLMLKKKKKEAKEDEFFHSISAALLLYSILQIL